MGEVACDGRRVSHEATNRGKGACKTYFLTKIYSFLLMEIRKARGHHLTLCVKVNPASVASKWVTLF